MKPDGNVENIMSMFFCQIERALCLVGGSHRDGDISAVVRFNSTEQSKILQRVTATFVCSCSALSISSLY